MQNALEILLFDNLLNEASSTSRLHLISLTSGHFTDKKSINVEKGTTGLSFIVPPGILL